MGREETDIHSLRVKRFFDFEWVHGVLVSVEERLKESWDVSWTQNLNKRTNKNEDKTVPVLK